MLHLEDTSKEEELKPDQISMSSATDNSVAQSAPTSESESPLTPNIEVTVPCNSISGASMSTGSNETVATISRASEIKGDKKVTDQGMEAPVVRSRSPSPKPSPKKSAEGGKAL